MDAFRGFVIGGIIVSIIISNINKFIGGIVSLLVTTGILIYGLDVYSKPGWTMTFFNIEVSQGFFLVIIAVWYFFDIRQIIQGKKEGDLVRDIKNQAEEKLRAGVAAKDVVNQVAITMEIADENTRDAVKEILAGKDYKTIITEQIDRKQLDMGNAVLHYQAAVDLLNDLQKITKDAAKKHDIPIVEEELTPYFLPSVKVRKAKAVSMTKRVNKDELIFSYNDHLITTVEELAAESTQVSPENKVDLKVIFMDTNTRAWNHKTMQVKGGKLEIDGVTNS